MSTAHTMHVNVYEPLKEDVAEMTDGRVNITIHPGGALASGAEHYDAAATGVVDIACVIPQYTRGRFPITLLPDLPMLFESSSQAGMVMWELYNTVPEFQEDFRDTKVLMMATVDVGQVVTNYPVNDMGDLEGHEIRSPGEINSMMLERVGATPVSMPIGEVYDALERGVVDGAMVPYSTLRSFSIHEVATHVMEVNTDVTTIATVMNLDAWERLSPEDQKILEELGEHYSRVIGEAYDEDAAAGKQLAIDEGMEVIEYTDEELEEWIELFRPIHDEWIEELEEDGYPGREIYEKALELVEQY